jgi:beta-glucosidase
MNVRLIFGIALICSIISFDVSSQQLKYANNGIPIYQNAKKSIEQRVDHILKLMTLDEKAGFLTGQDMWHFKGIERLGIPPMQVTDCGHGVTVILAVDGKAIGSASCFPTAVGQAATWNRDLIKELGSALGRETRATGSAMLLAPMVNIKRFPLNGRNYEIFSEDPFLSGELATSFIQGIQSEKVGAVIKAMTANNQQENQSRLFVNMDERTLQEIYLPSFRIPIEKAKPWGVMTAYNGLNGAHTSENKHMLQKVLKGDWGYDGFVVSDWRGVHSTKAIYSGLDLEMPGRPENFLTKENTLKAIQDKLLTMEELDDKVRRILRAYIKTGLVDYKMPELRSELNSERHQLLARKVAEEAIVLLKNKGNILPLKKSAIKRLAVIGPNAAEARLGGGGSASVTPFYSVSPLEGLKKFCGSDVEIVFEEGCGLNGNLKTVDSKYLKNSIDGKEGLRAEYYSNIELKGTPAVTSLDKTINFSWGWTNPKPEIGKGSYSVRWSGQLLPPVSGEYKMGISAAGNGYRLYMDGKLLIDEWKTSEDFEASLASSSRIVSISLKKGVPVDVQVEIYKRNNRNYIRFEWEIPGDNPMDLAKKVAAESDAVVIFAGLSNFFEGGANDRSDITLPGDQNILIREVVKINPNTVVVLINGSAVGMPWINDVNAILEAYYPGQEGGNAIANVLFGNVNPSGKLPETFPVKLSDNPAYGQYPGENNLVNYVEGIFVGYRHYDERHIEPLFPFGHGLSYTNFTYSDLEIKKSKKVVIANFQIQNTGDVDGAEVAQLYIRDVVASESRPPKELKNFEKVFLKAGEKKKISFEITDEDLSFFSAKQNKWIVEPGEFEILIGSSSRDIRLKKNFQR